ncbi:nucleotide sugar dehydrogenase [Halosimplex marinum]|uniref:nucleotide sugar dehydrogenase n=1 Tax=Halosimplex marinum TaxID=3396620 RepID=UPI003F55ACF2
MNATLAALDEQSDLDGLEVAVYGLGKMGLPLAAVLADSGATVHGVDIDSDVVAAVNDGRSPVSEPGLPALLEDHGGGALTATTDGAAAARRADVMIVLVPTVVDGDGDPDLGPVLAAGEAIREGVDAGDLVVLESTVPPGTTAGAFADAVEPDDLVAGEDFGLAHCPERTSSGRVLRDLTESYPKIVGATSADATAVAADFYRTFNEPGVVELPGATAAEMVKVSEGIYRDVNIALANELAKACEEWGLDAGTVFEAANTQPFCEIHDPGVGVGGHCIPVYPHFVIDGASETPLLETARAVNDGMPAHTAELVTDALDARDVAPTDARVLVLGLTYRPGVRETRFAPAFDLVDELDERGVSVAAHDPLLTAEAVERAGATPVEDPLDGEWDAVALATGHEEYRDIDLGALRERMRTPVLVDGRDFFDPEAVAAFDYRCVGDGTTLS